MGRKTPPHPFSIRMDESTLTRLEAGARRRGEPKARTAERLIDEGLRMEDHPGIVFRDGATGRRAALAAGPDVWRVIELLEDIEQTGEEAIAAAAKWVNLPEGQIRNALRYYTDHPEEIDERIRSNREFAKREHAAWKREQKALG